jgi:hypothetical protein
MPIKNTVSKISILFAPELHQRRRVGNDCVEELLHHPVAGAFPCPAGETEHRHPSCHAQHRLGDPAHTPHIRFRQIGLHTL